MQNKRLHIIMPMAGEGNRFKNAGYTTPKPLIKLNGKEIDKHSLSSLNGIEDKDIEIVHTFIIRKEFELIKEDLLNSYPEANVILVEKTTNGSLETCMLAKDFIEDNDRVIILDCDVMFKSEQYINIIKNNIGNNIQYPLLLGFYSHDPKYSYAEYEDNGSLINNVIRTAEKIPISNCALAGCYYVGNGKTFKERAQRLIDDFYHNEEFGYKEIYVSLLYNYMKDLNPYVYKMNVYKDNLWSLGTPQDLERFSFDRNVWD